MLYWIRLLAIMMAISVWSGTSIPALAASSVYDVYQGEKLLKRFDNKLSAITYAKKWGHASVRQEGNWVWNNYPYQVYQYNKKLKEFDHYAQAVRYARKWDHAAIVKMPGPMRVWDNYPYEVFQYNKKLKSFQKAKEAVRYAKDHPGSVVRQEGQMEPVFLTGQPFHVYQNQKFLKGFTHLKDAIPYARRWEHSRVVREKDRRTIWEFKDSVKGYSLLDVPLIRQNPELPRGCEVTTLAMLLHYAGKPVDKMALAEQVIKDSTPVKKKGNQIISWGDPELGFVGNMYDMDKPGFGVYHEPLTVLANQYLKGNALDLTGGEFQDVLRFLEKGVPVLTIINSRFRPVQDWVTWRGPQGVVRATFREHAVLLVGYDHRYVYINDPLRGYKNRKVSRFQFEKGWIQMGRQAVTYMN